MRLAALLVGLAIPGCDAPPAPVTGYTCDPDTRVCVADPVATWLSTDSCVTSTECPSGTICDTGGVAAEINDSACTEDDYAGCQGDDCACEGLSAACGTTGTCKLAGAADVAPSALIDAFGGRSLVLDPYDTDAGYSGFSWQAPGEAEDYVVVACKLYGCPPVIEEACPAGDCSQSAPVMVMSNYDRCVLASKQTSGGAGSFDLGSAAYRYDPADVPGTCTDGGVPSPVASTQPIKVIGLLFGCVAYGGTEILAASDLVSVEVSRVHPDLSRVVEDCAGADDGTSCSSEHLAELGSCSDGACLARCIRDTDCPEQTCSRRPYEFVGVCGAAP